MSHPPRLGFFILDKKKITESEYFELKHLSASPQEDWQIFHLGIFSFYPIDSLVLFYLSVEQRQTVGWEDWPGGAG